LLELVTGYRDVCPGLARGAQRDSHRCGEHHGIPADDPYAKHGEPKAWAEYRQILKEAGLSLDLQPILKWDFYAAVESTDHVLTVQTADQALWAKCFVEAECAL
jgi:hypothetical protein